MPVDIIEQRFAEPLARRLRRERPRDAILLHWLGQAGFVVTAGPHRVLIDPYLSDSLAEKHGGTPYPHERLMPSPVRLAELGHIDLVLATHHHTDHMDPGTLAPLAARQSGLRFVVPEASRDEALRRTGTPLDRLILMDAGRTVEPLPGLTVTGMRAAHEELEQDQAGHHRFLGYVLRFDMLGPTPVVLFHSGDTVPFAGQDEEAARQRPDLLLLPVNGRSAELKSRGVPGNLTLDEAVALAARVGCGATVAHHHGLFAFNTRPFADIERKATEPDLPVRLIPARLDLELRLQLA